MVGGYGSSNGGAGTLVISETGSGGGGGGGGGGLGADVIVGSIPNVSQYGSVVVSGQTIMAYAFGTTSCNIGTAQLEWFASPDSRHPFIPMKNRRGAERNTTDNDGDFHSDLQTVKQQNDTQAQRPFKFERD